MATMSNVDTAATLGSTPISTEAKISTGSSAAPASGCANCGGASAVAPAGLNTVSAESAPGDAGAARGYRER